MTSSAPRRDQVLAALIDEMNSRLDGSIPSEVEGVERIYGDPAVLVKVLETRWFATLTTHVEQALAELPEETERAVVRGWRRAADDLPGLRLALDTWWEESSGSERRKAERRRNAQRTWMAHQAGIGANPRVEAPRNVASTDVEAGRLLEEAARARFDPHRQTGRQQPRRTFVERIRSIVV